MESETASQPAGDHKPEQTQEQQHLHQYLQQQQPRWYFDERDGHILWLRGEFAAANAIIDLLCQHLQLSGTPGEYDQVLDTIQRRRYNWSQVLHMQQYYTVADVSIALQQLHMKNRLSPVSLYSPGERTVSEQQSSVVNGGSKTDERGPSPGNKTDDDEESILANGVSTLDITEEASKSHHPANSRKFVFGIEEIEGEQVHARDGLELHERLVDEKTCSELLELIDIKKKQPAKRVTTIQFGTITSVLCEEELDADVYPDVLVEENVPSFLEPVVDRLLKLEIIPPDKRPDSWAVSTLEPGDGGTFQCHHSFEQPTCILSLGSDSLLTVERKGGSAVEVPFNLNLSLSVGSLLLLREISLELIEVSPSESFRVLVVLGKLKSASPVSSPRATSSTPARSPATGGTGVFFSANGSATSMNGYPELQ